MTQRPIILGIVGDSAAGKTTLTRGIAKVLGEEDVTVICTDDYHRYDRQQRAEMGISALHPDCNYMDIIQQHLALLRTGQSILKPIYNHTSGQFDPPEYIQPKRFVVVEGLLGYSTRAARDCYDVKVYLAPPESLRAAWKIKRDTSKRGYTEAQVRDQIAKRENDSESFIRPQRRWADMVVSFCPPGSEVDPASASPASANPVPETDASGGESQGNDLLLDVRLVLRPTISQPDLSDILANSYETSEAVRLGLTRDMGQPADLLEIDGHATAEQVQAMERTLCNDVARLGQFCSLTGNNDLGRITGTTGETLQSFPLAITQLLITYHMLKAARVQQ